MRILILVISHTLQDKKWWHNLRALPSSLIGNLTSEDAVDIIACTSEPENLPRSVNWACGDRSISFHGKQFSKVSYLLSIWQHRYDWYIKTRPEMLMREPINLETLSPGAINARARQYYGPRRIKYGASLGGNTVWSNIYQEAFQVDSEEKNLLLDDQIYIFDDKVRQSTAFDPVDPVPCESEWFHTEIWTKRGIKLEVIGIHTFLETHGVLSGDLAGL